MAQPDKDASVLAHIQHLVAEEHRLFERGAGYVFTAVVEIVR